MREHLETSLDIKEAHFGIDHAETSLTLANLGMALSALGDVDEARDLSRQALVICNQQNTRRHAMVLMRAAITHQALGEFWQAEELVSTALHSLVELLGSTLLQEA